MLKPKVFKNNIFITGHPISGKFSVSNMISHDLSNNKGMLCVNDDKQGTLVIRGWERKSVINILEIFTEIWEPPFRSFGSPDIIKFVDVKGTFNRFQNDERQLHSLPRKDPEWLIKEMRFSKSMHGIMIVFSLSGNMTYSKNHLRFLREKMRQFEVWIPKIPVVVVCKGPFEWKRRKNSFLLKVKPFIESFLSIKTSTMDIRVTTSEDQYFFLWGVDTNDNEENKRMNEDTLKHAVERMIDLIAECRESRKTEES